MTAVVSGVVKRAGPALARAARLAPWGLLGTLVLAAGVERTVSRHSVYVMSPVERTSLAARRAAATSAREADVLCLGDSLMLDAVLPRGVAERSGLRVRSLAVPGGQAQASEALLRRALDHGARPRAIVVDFFPSLLTATPREDVRQFGCLLGPVDVARVAWEAGDPELLGAVCAAKALPSVRYREGLRTLLTHLVEGSVVSNAWANLVIDRQLAKNDGALLTDSKDGLDPPGEAELTYWRTSFFSRTTWQPTHLAAMDRLFSLARSRGVKVVWVLPPYHPAAQGWLDASGRDAEHVALVRSWQARYPEITVVDGRRAFTEPSAFHDLHHLAATGSYRFSLALGDSLRRLDRGGQAAADWLTTGPLHPTPLPAGVESFDESSVALGAAASRLD